jgi:putative protease
VRTKPEILAPAGNIESFFAAVENGADAVYLGLKHFSARATASNFSLEELATVIPFAHGRGVRIYAALNSQIAEDELPELLDTINSLASLKPDALIVQDAGIFHFVRRSFPGLKLHSSTLAGTHNSAGVNALHKMGAERVILARELSVEEIEQICSATQTELEIFIHGALCYSYSGTCLASSYRGGRSGLRGECVQPCRLKFSQGKKEGFFLSCNDLCALPLIPKLKRLRIAAFKIEGRMKPAAYVADVVKAYRTVLDAESGDEEKDALARAAELLSNAPSRRLTSGHFEGAGAGSIISPHRSGSSGTWSATVKSADGGRILVDLRHPVAKGDRLRPESGSGKEERAFSVSEIFDRAGGSVVSAPGGVQVYLACRERFSAGDRLFKVGTKSKPVSSIWKKIRAEVPSGIRFKPVFPGRQKILEDLRKLAAPRKNEHEILILKTASADEVVAALKSAASMVLIEAGKKNLERIARQRFSPAQIRKLGFSLPPVIPERDVGYFGAAVQWFIKKGFVLWEVNNWGHFDMMEEGRGLRLIAGSRLNLRNSAAFVQAAELGCLWIVPSIEITKEELKRLSEERTASRLIPTVYCWPALFTSPLVPNVNEERPFVSARNETYQPVKTAGRVHIYADRPVSLFERLGVLRSFGYRNFLIDVSEGPENRRHSLESVLRWFASAKSPAKHSLFNFERGPHRQNPPSKSNMH